MTPLYTGGLKTRRNRSRGRARFCLRESGIAVEIIVGGTVEQSNGTTDADGQLVQPTPDSEQIILTGERPADLAGVIQDIAFRG